MRSKEVPGTEYGRDHARSRDGYTGMWANWKNMAAGSKNAAGGRILTCIVKETIQMGRGQVVGTVNVSKWGGDGAG